MVPITVTWLIFQSARSLLAHMLSFTQIQKTEFFEQGKVK